MYNIYRSKYPATVALKYKEIKVFKLLIYGKCW